MLTIEELHETTLSTGKQHLYVVMDKGVLKNYFRAIQITGSDDNIQEINDSLLIRGRWYWSLMPEPFPDLRYGHKAGFSLKNSKAAIHEYQYAKVGDWVIMGNEGLDATIATKEAFIISKAVPYGTLFDNKKESGMDFGEALRELKAGKRVTRAGWNAQGMFVYYVPEASYPVQTDAAKEHFGEHAMVPYEAYFALKNSRGKISTWVPSISDCLAEDWSIVADKPKS